MNQLRSAVSDYGERGGILFLTDLTTANHGVQRTKDLCLRESSCRDDICYAKCFSLAKHSVYFARMLWLWRQIIEIVESSVHVKQSEYCGSKELVESSLDLGR